MHNGFLNISGEKMSKSLGNFFTVHELLDQYPGEVIRLLLLTAHYRQPLDFTHEGLQQTKAMLDRWYGGGPLPAHRVQIAPADSHPIVEDLGLPGHDITTLVATWMNYDFTMESGRVVHHDP